MAGTAASTIISAVGVIVMARLLGPAGYGVYTLALVPPALFVSVADLGVSPALTRYAASLRSQQNYGRLASMLLSGLVFKVLTGTAAFLFVFVFSSQLASLVLHRYDMGQLVGLASVIILFQGMFNLSYNTFVGLDRMDRSALMAIIRDTTRMALATVLIVAGFGVVGAILGQVSASVLVGLIGLSLMLAMRQVLKNTVRNDQAVPGLREDIGTMMQYGLPLYLGSLSVTVLSQYQNIVLAFFTSNTEIGNFNATVNFGALVLIFANPVAAGLFPAFSKLDLQTRKDDLKRMFELAVRYTTLVIFPVAVCVATLSGDLIQVVYGASFTEAPWYLLLYMGIFLLTGLGQYVISNFLSGVGKTKETLKVMLVQLAAFLPLAPFMVWLWRVPGLIVALALSGLVSTSFGLRLATRDYGMHVDLKRSLATLVAALASAVPVFFLVHVSPFPSLLNALAGAAVYLAAYLTLAPMFKAVKRPDLEILASILGQIKIAKVVTNRILAYEAWVLDAAEGKVDGAPR